MVSVSKDKFWADRSIVVAPLDGAVGDGLAGGVVAGGGTTVAVGEAGAVGLAVGVGVGVPVEGAPVGITVINVPATTGGFRGV